MHVRVIEMRRNARNEALTHCMHMCTFRRCSNICECPLQRTSLDAPPGWALRKHANTSQTCFERPEEIILSEAFLSTACCWKLAVLTLPSFSKDMSSEAVKAGRESSRYSPISPATLYRDSVSLQTVLTIKVQHSSLAGKRSTALHRRG